jgi:hypothetical protein
MFLPIPVPNGSGCEKSKDRVVIKTARAKSTQGALSMTNLMQEVEEVARGGLLWSFTKKLQVYE